MKKIILSLSIVLISTVMFLGFNACQKEVVQGRKTNKVVQKSINDFAKNLATDLRTKNHEIKSKMIERFNQTKAEEFLLVELLAKNLTNNVNLRNADAYNQLQMVNPELTVAFPAYNVGESFESHINSIDYVVILDENIDDENSQTTTLNAYDQNGNFVTISSEFNENLNYAVVLNSEFYIAVHDNTFVTVDEIVITPQIQNFQPYMEVGDWNLYTQADIGNSEFMDMGIYGGNPPQNGSGGSTGGGLTCDRDPRIKKDELHKIKFDGHYVERTYESRWRMPHFEMAATYAIYRGGTTGSNVQLIQKSVRRHKNDVHGQYCPDLQLDIATWTPEMGDKWQVAWVEIDDRKNSKLEFNLGFTTKADVISAGTATASIKYTIDFKEGDKLLGSSLIEFCDAAKDEGTEYKVCDVDGQGFWFRERIRN